MRTNGYVVISRDGDVMLDYPDAEKDGAVPAGQPVQGVSFHHGRFIQKLRASAAATDGYGGSPARQPLRHMC